MKKEKRSYQDQLKEFSEYLRRFNNFIDFKIENPYSEKNLEFEICPTPRAHSNKLPENEQEVNKFV